MLSLRWWCGFKFLARRPAASWTSKNSQKHKKKKTIPENSNSSSSARQQQQGGQQANKEFKCNCRQLVELNMKKKNWLRSHCLIWWKREETVAARMDWELLWVDYLLSFISISFEVDVHAEFLVFKVAGAFLSSTRSVNSNCRYSSDIQPSTRWPIRTL